MRLIITFGVLFLISAIQAQDLECYVCTDCETNYENLKGTCSGSGEESGSGSGEESGSGSGEESGSGSGEESGSGSGSADGSGSGSEDGSASGGGSSGDNEEESDNDNGVNTQYENSNVRVASNDENSNLKSANRFGNSDYYSVQMADTNGDRTVSRKDLTRFARSTRDDDTLEARCVVTSYEVNSTTKIKRGCAYGSGTDAQKCLSLLGANYTETPSRCSVCAENLCNTAYKSYGSFHLQFAFIALIIGIFINA